MEQRVRLQREMINRQVIGAERQRSVDIDFTFDKTLLGQSKHQIEIDVVKIFLGDINGAAGFIVVMDAPKCLQMPGIKTLNTNR